MFSATFLRNLLVSEISVQFFSDLSFWNLEGVLLFDFVRLHFLEEALREPIYFV